MSSNILLVDDDTMFRTLTGRTLEKCGYAVETAVDGQAAWELLDAAPRRFDLVLSDRHMPRLDGLELLMKIKGDPRLGGIPVVMLTSENQQEEIARGLSEGAYQYLIKPAGRELLDAALRNVLEECRIKRQLQELAGQHVNHLKLLRRAQFRIRTLQDAKDLALLLADVSRNPARTVSGFMELLINAIEHGNLAISYAEKGMLLKEGRWEEEVEARLLQPQYSSRYAEIELERNDTVCTVIISDQGCGFDWSGYLQFDPARAFDLHGRGIALSKATCFDSLEYHGNGSTVVVAVGLPAED